MGLRGGAGAWLQAQGSRLKGSGMQKKEGGAFTQSHRFQHRLRRAVGERARQLDHPHQAQAGHYRTQVLMDKVPRGACVRVGWDVLSCGWAKRRREGGVVEA